MQCLLAQLYYNLEELTGKAPVVKLFLKKD